MEGERRKRSGEREKRNEEREKRNKVRTEEATEEEVEEFFTILRRMQEAVKYFGEGWREAVEATAAVIDNGDMNDEEGEEIGMVQKKEEINNNNNTNNNNNGVLDLNTEPASPPAEE